MRPNGLIREQDAEGCSGEREQQRLGEKLADDAAARSSDGRAQCEFLLAGAVPRASRRIETLPQPMASSRSDGSEEQIECATDVMHKIFVQPLDVEFEIFTREMVGRLFFELLHQWRERGAGCGLTDTGLRRMPT